MRITASLLLDQKLELPVARAMGPTNFKGGPAGRLIGIGMGQLFLPESFRFFLVRHHLGLLLGIAELDLTLSFAHPVEKELHGSPADAA